MYLLTTLTHNSELQAITALSLISTFYKSQQQPLSLSQLAFFTNRSLATAFNSGGSSASSSQVLLSQPPVQNSCQLTINWIPGWRPLHTYLLVFSSQADFEMNWQLNPLTHQPATSRHFTQLNSWQLTAGRLMFSLYKLEVDPTVNTTSNNPFIVVMAIA
jgi:hypothetical protein